MNQSCFNTTWIHWRPAAIGDAMAVLDVNTAWADILERLSKGHIQATPVVLGGAKWIQMGGLR